MMDSWRKINMPEQTAKSKILGVIKTQKSTVETAENRVTEKSQKTTTRKKATTPILATENLPEQSKTLLGKHLLLTFELSDRSTSGE
jgi:hypothetical protein